MRVLVAGATGALGRPLVRLLVASGHEVVGLTRRPERVRQLAALGARGVVADALDGDALCRALAEARPTAVVHLLTALPPEGPLRASDLVPTNELRVRGTANLLRAAIEAGASRLVGESFAGVYVAGGDEPLGEDAPLPPLAGPFAEAVAAMRSLERQLAEARERIETVVLRFALVYGPEVPATVALARRLRRRQVFVPRGADGVASFVHADDAASAVLAALNAALPAPVYNVADDRPVRITEYLALCAQALGAPPPRSAPAFVVRWFAPLLAQGAFTRLPLSNARIKRELGWQPAWPTLWQGVPAVARALVGAPGLA